MRRAIGIIGFGNMGSAIAESLKNKYKIYVFDKERYKTQSISGLVVARDILDLANKVDTLILAVKPHDFENLLEVLKEIQREKLIVSVAAGITTTYIEKRLKRVKVIRAMPNILVKINQSVTCLCRGTSADENDLAFVEGLFTELGVTLKIKEEMMDAATAVSGSGPGFYFALIQSQSKTDDYKVKQKEITKDFIIKLSEAARGVGFNPTEAELLASHTGTSCAIFLTKSNLSPSELVIQVASRGGTTEAGLDVLRKGGSLTEAVEAAKKRAAELSRKE